MNLDVARQVADAVLYEGYVLYPYRASAKKNQVRWQFGVLYPPAHARAQDETSSCLTECLVEPGEDCSLNVKARFLQLQSKRVQEATGVKEMPFRNVESLEAGGSLHITFDEAVDREVEAETRLEDIAEPRAVPFDIEGGEESEWLRATPGEPMGRIVRRRAALSGELRMTAALLEGPYGAAKLRIEVLNTTPGEFQSRDEALTGALIATHLLIAVNDGSFISLLEPPQWAAGAAKSCVNQGVFPVLVGAKGERDMMLSSPIILYDYPEVAAESPGDMFDATEIDEILSLRTMALTDDEKEEARATDQRAAALIDRVDSMPQEMLDRLHGAVRYLKAATSPSDEQTNQEAVPWWDPGSDASVSPETDAVMIAGVPVGKGSRVRLTPGLKRADAHDMFLKGKVARVEGIFRDVDDNTYVAVSLDDDPAADLQRWHGRFLYFSPDEVQPLDVRG